MPPPKPGRTSIGGFIPETALTLNV